MSISVIIPAHNAEQFLAAAIESVLAQTRPATEIIVVNDGSTDRTERIARQFASVQLHSTPNEGAGAARNTGVRSATSDLISFLDADDLWLPEKLSLQMQQFELDYGLEAVFGHAVEFGAGRSEHPMRAPVPGTMLIKREAFARIGWFDSAPRVLEGADWFLRAREKALRFTMLPQVVYRRRVHGANRSILQRDHSGYVRAIKASLDRRRLHAAAERA